MSGAAARRGVLVQTAGCVALTLVAAGPLQAYYAGPGWLPPVAAAAVAGGLVAGPLRLWRRDAVSAVISVLAGAMLVGALVTLPSALGAGRQAGPVARAVLDDLWQAWARLLTVGVPALTSPALLVLPVMAGWTAAALSTLGAMRTRQPLLPVLPPLVLFVLTLLLGASRDERQPALTAAFAGLALLLAAGRAAAQDGAGEDDPQTPAEPAASPAGGDPAPPGQDDAGQITAAGAGALPVTAARLRRWRGSRVRGSRGIRVVVGAGLLAAVTGLGVATAALMPGGGRFDPRSLRDPALDTRTTLSPLVSLKSRLTVSPPQTVLTATVHSARTWRGTLRLRTAALDDFDGVTWTSGGVFHRPAATLRVAEQAGGRGSAVTVDATVEELPDGLLPAPGEPLSLQAHDAELDAVTGTVVVWDRAVTSGYQYRTTGWVPVPDTDIVDALPDTGGSAARSVALPPGMPPGIRTLALQLTADAANPYQRMKALETYLRSLTYGESVAPGESYAVVARTVMPSPTSPVTSFAEQRASAFAVMARALGLPARVAVGYVVPEPAVRSGRITVTTAQAHAWPEVHFAGYGWVAFEPTDPTRTMKSPATAAGGYASRDVLDAAAVTAELSRPPDVRDQPEATLPWLPFALAALLPLAVAVVWLVKRFRRRRRCRAAGTAARIVGAWQEALDRLVEAGVALPACLTPAEVAAEAGRALGMPAGKPLLALGPLVEEAVFAPWAPAEAAAGQAWRCERELTRAIAGRTPLLLRWRRQVDPRPLMRRAPGPVLAAPAGRRRTRRWWPVPLGGRTRRGQQ
ncbi:MAG TPA: transglutaminaseTgpA domain-containing protein, partial [Kineosporiaceae bacterium]|nr:transglutaminaseTgpA domain-containing protein [Kineosporiaceae bacterium]